jgi:plastocyanin
MKKVFILLIVFLAVMMLAACGGNNAVENDVTMNEPVPVGAEDAFVVELEFSEQEIIPDRITIPGDTDILFVIYNSDTNEGGLNEDHNLVGPEIGLTEILVIPGQTVRRLWHSFGEPGEYRVGCTIHPWIQMTIVIE